MVTAIGCGAWAVQVATSDIRGRGNAARTVNRADNRLAQQAYFEQTFQDIKAADQRLTQLAADKASHIEGADIRYSGAVTYCQQLVADYNSAAHKQIAAKFRDAGLPTAIDPVDITTDCRENR